MSKDDSITINPIDGLPIFMSIATQMELNSLVGFFDCALVNMKGLGRRKAKRYVHMLSVAALEEGVPMAVKANLIDVPGIEEVVDCDGSEFQLLFDFDSLEGWYAERDWKYKGEYPYYEIK